MYIRRYVLYIDLYSTYHRLLFFEGYKFCRFHDISDNCEIYHIEDWKSSIVSLSDNLQRVTQTHNILTGIMRLQWTEMTILIIFVGACTVVPPKPKRTPIILYDGHLSIIHKLISVLKCDDLATQNCLHLRIYNLSSFHISLKNDSALCASGNFCLWNLFPQTSIFVYFPQKEHSMVATYIYVPTYTCMHFINYVCTYVLKLIINISLQISYVIVNFKTAACFALIIKYGST